VSTQGAQLPLAGLLLALPALEMTGLLPVAEVLPPMRNGFYGLRPPFLMGVFLALLRDPRAEAATRIRPADLGRLRGLDRATEVKTLRRKLSELARHGKGAALQATLGPHRARRRTSGTPPTARSQDQLRPAQWLNGSSHQRHCRPGDRWIEA